ncbi:038R [Cherax quadricarinatus iridovirus]|uniref:Haloacid dehalogenase-like hydrolase n=1 Tax=Shrimp hemocyte iridescent virus TaxID=2039780 RepID=A0A291B0U8_9VIRU|nr:038R [Cherax quadricarinatus iridovirus]YP_010084865.1 haloacid dehalogenase-like hydrolase [Shrimp hemocyte iridescent virus]UPA43357.1 haloacid dehalogenase-like hydrolase [Iridovirus CN01]ASZ85018.1 038R [Cherax quadricarinatus iridovirus]ATE87122.1 haloacid dehalogenase-like hydrolase [Shrimp hemocyte iridescent virus]UPA43592.1 haloacid dehalogenase-like hydrolase [Iridovirus CN01]UPA43627.1 haloacid dehalogenase-like hydrolase [Iridovirus CN01]
MYRFKKINILLDLDNTLISSISKKEEKPIFKPRMKQFRWENMEDYYKVFERPGLQPFLDYLFENFNVSVWTAASKSYALFIIEKFILQGHPERKLDYIFFSYHCKKSKRARQTQKSLDILKNEFDLLDYDMSKTYIIDDHPEVFSYQPENCINIKAFEFTDRKSWEDDELATNIIPRLERIRLG